MSSHKQPTLRICAVLALALTPILALASMMPSAGGKPLPSLAPMLKQVTPAVVNISSKTHLRQRSPFANDPLLSQFFGIVPRQRVEQSLGSGVIVDAAKGLVLTNNHVIAGADDITVTLHDGRNLKAQMVGADPDTDIALIRIHADHLTALKLADSRHTRVGDFVVAVGDPFGLGQTVTSGIVSALGRSGLGHTYQNFIQTDAPINPGNSGGALVNLNGELIGINSMIYSPSGASAGIGFAIPSHLAREVMKQLLTYGKVRRGTLGVETQALTRRIAGALGLGRVQGLVVTHVQAASPAARAGLRSGDVLIALNQRALHKPQDLRNAEGLLTVGSKMRLDVRRDGKALILDARIEPPKLAQIDGSRLDPRLRGVELQDLPRRQRVDGRYGVEVIAVDPSSHAGASGLRPGDVVLAINQQPLAGVQALKRLFANAQPRQLLLSIVRERQVYYLLLH